MIELKKCKTPPPKPDPNEMMGMLKDFTKQGGLMGIMDMISGNQEVAQKGIDVTERLNATLITLNNNIVILIKTLNLKG